MARFILNLISGILIINSLVSQKGPESVLDTLVAADQVYIDPLNQLYLVNHTDKSIAKYSLQFELLKRISYNKGWDQAILDVSDPFKCLLFYPGDFKIYILDESLAQLSSYEESELNFTSRICHFSTDKIGLFSNNVLKLKSFQQTGSISSDLLQIPNSQKVNLSNKLKKSNEYLYLFIAGQGIYRFTQQLFEDRRWINPEIQLMDVSGETIFYLENDQLVEINTRTKSQKLLFSQSSQLKSLAVNADYLVLLYEKRMSVYRIR